jgi:dephospho-CoA kinase
VIRVALTGGIASGKSHVQALFARLGVPTIDADQLARHAVVPGSQGLTAIAERFGPLVLDNSGALDRRALAAIVFADPAARRDLEAIVHPSVQQSTNRWFETLDPAAHVYAIADIPLLYEVGRDRDFAKVIVAACDPDTQVARVIARDALTEAEARQRLAAQMPIADKVSRADFVIDTEGSFDDTERQVRAIDAILRITSSD